MALRLCIPTVLVIAVSFGPATPSPAQVRVDVGRRSRYPAEISQRAVEVEAAIRLMEHPATLPARIHPELRGGVLTLTGRVTDARARASAEQLVLPVAGGISIRNELEVGTQPAPRPIGKPDGRLASRAREELSRAVPELMPNLFVTSFGNVLVVEGVVQDIDGRWAVSQALESLPNAEAIRNVTYMRTGARRVEKGTHVSVPIHIGNLFGIDLEVGSRRGVNFDVWAAGHPTGVYLDWSGEGPDDEALADAFRRAAASDGRVNLEKLDVRVDAGVLFLRGTLPSQAARMRAVALARAVGVRGVVDETELAGEPPPFSAPYYERGDLERYLEYYLATRGGAWRVDVHEKAGRTEVSGHVLTPFHEETARLALAELPGMKDQPITLSLRVVRPGH